MNELALVLANLIEKYSSLVVTLGVVSFVVILVLVVAIFAVCIKSFIDFDKRWNDRHHDRHGRR